MDLKSSGFEDLVALAPLFVSPRAGDRFEHGLSLLIDGLAHRLAARDRRRRR